MPKRSTGYTPARGKSNPLDKQEQPLKMPGLNKAANLPTPLSGPNNVAKLGKGKLKSNYGPKLGGLGRPAAIAPKTPRI